MTMKASCSGEKLFELADRFTTTKSLADTIVFNNRLAAEKPLSLAAVAAKVSTEGRPRTRVDVRRTELRLRADFVAFMRKTGNTVEFTDDDDGRQADKTIAQDAGDSSTVVEKPSPAPKAPEPAQVAEVAHAIATSAPKEDAKPDGRCKLIEHDGQKKTAKEWADAAGISMSAFYNRRSLGWPMAKILGTPQTVHHDGKVRVEEPKETSAPRVTRQAPAPKASGRTVDELRAKIHRLDEIDAQIAALQKAREELTAELEGRAA